MELEVAHAYDAGLDKVLEAFLSEGHILAKNDKVGARNVQIKELSRTDQTAKLVFSRELKSSAAVPGFLASFAREWNQVRQEEHWFRKDDDEWHCEYRVHLEGVPAKIKGTMRLQGNGESCTNHVSLDVRCDLPLIGKKVAKFILDDSRTKMDLEHGVSRTLINDDL
ncbi:DUF2505 domain-containing protein [Marinobacter zhejiangensis]|uniref:DUF2505 domain-containing protein n=1 Tax=Marinobacter zhejiangensis TaxID=488535 RepID=A0A1I4SUR9_9GAMM|nr:DUF2505 domain-containing protein [Marinobacter zhejiangensis]SFM68171.1 Protein of unknown function [Marinobacter zhejiangensis]